MAAFASISALTITALLVLASWLWRDQEKRHLVPAAVGTAVGLAAFMAAYIWVFDVGSQCSTRADFGCQLNANQGVLTLFGLALAAGALWTTLLIRFFDRRSARQELERHADAALRAALEEVRHNLIHVALGYEGGQDLKGWPMLKIDHVSRLLDEPVRRELDDAVIRRAEALTRLAPAYDAFVTGDADDEGDVRGAAEPFCFEAMANNHLGLMIAAGATSEVGHEFLHQPGLQDLHHAAMSARPQYVYFRTSDPEATMDAPKIRTDDGFVICWWNDAHHEGLDVFAQGPRFADLAKGHTH